MTDWTDGSTQPAYAGSILRPPRSRFFRELYATRTDLAALSEALRAEFPRLAFIGFEYWQEFRPSERNNAPRSPAPDPGDAKPRLYQSFADPAEPHLRAWLEPENWRPRWSQPYSDGFRYLLNGPRSFLVYRRIDFVAVGRRPGTRVRFDNPPKARDEKEIIRFGPPSPLWGAWHPDDQEGAAFVRRAFKIASNLSDDAFFLCEAGAGRPVSRRPWHGGTLTRAGLDAIRWANSRRRNYFSDGGDWLKPADYPFTAADFAHLRRRPAKVRAPA